MGINSEGQAQLQPDKKLITRVQETLRLKHYSFSTEKTYVGHIYNFIGFHSKRHPFDLRENEIKEYLTYLAVKKKVSASTQNQALNAIVFLYKHVLHIEIGDFSSHVRAKKSSYIPTVLSKEETNTFFSYAKPGIFKLMLQLLYGCGLRLRELFNLRIHDIDFDNKQIIIRSAKGNKDRTVS
jgi:site-specific recombinase XerD